jgi:hypothetical protein
MAAPLENQYYLLRVRSGRQPEYTPEALLQRANEYFEWVEQNPFKEEVLFHSQGIVTRDYVTKKRPLTLEGFCIYANIVKKTFWNYEKSQDFLQVTSYIRETVENQQLELASAGFLNANIIARKLGLSDKSEVKVSQEQPLFGDD